MRVSVRDPGSFGRSRRWTLYVIGMGIWLSGGLWLLFHNFLVKQGEFGPEANPLEPWCLKVHGAFAVAAIWIFGLLWGIHVTMMWPYSRRRWSGGIMAGVLAWLTLSGYLLYYVGNERARSIVSVLHWTIGLGCPVVFLWHRFNFRPKRGKRTEFSADSISYTAGAKVVADECLNTSTPDKLGAFAQQRGGDEENR